MYYLVEFKDKEGGSSTSIRLYSHYTGIQGEMSGESKSYFVSKVSEGMTLGTLDISASLIRESNDIQTTEKLDISLPFYVADGGNIEGLIKLEQRSVILLDESTMFRDEVIREINECKHLIIGVSRGFPFKADYPMCGLYYLERDNDIFSIKSLPPLPLMEEGKEYRNIITESLNGRSECQLLSRYLGNVYSSGGKDRIQNKLRVLTGSTLVFTDLGNIGRQYRLLMKRSRSLDVQFYDYLCFEQLLYESEMTPKDYISDKSNFSELTLERLYEYLMEQSTAGTNLQYTHKTPIVPKEYLNKDNFAKVFSGNCSKKIKQYIERYGNKEKRI